MLPRILVWGWRGKDHHLFWSDHRGDDPHPQLKGLHLPKASQTWWHCSSHISVAKEQYQDDKGITFVCTPCPPGTSQPFGAQVACESCNAGEHQPESGSMSCRRCDIGSYQVSTESRNVQSKKDARVVGFFLSLKNAAVLERRSHKIRYFESLVHWCDNLQSIQKTCCF